jgi:hypothetical protein
VQECGDGQIFIASGLEHQPGNKCAM